MNSDDLKNKGNKAFSEGRYDQAIIHFTDAINVDPKNHILYSNRSGAYASMKEYKKALEDADKTIDIKPDWAKGYSRKVTALIYLGNYDEAEKVANQGLEVEPGNAQLKQGLEDIKKAKSHKNNEDSAENMIGGLFKGDVLAKLAASPETARYMTQPDFVNIIQQIQKNPSLMNAYMKDPRVLSAIGVLLGVPLTTATPEQFAQQQEEEQRRQQPKPEPKKEEPKKEEKQDVPMPDLTPEKKQAEEEKAKGNDAYKKKDFDTAIAHYTKAFELDPENVIYLINRSAAKFEKGDYLDCIKDCELSIEEGRKYKYDYKNVAKAYTRMGNAYMKLDNLEQAIVWYDKSLTEDRNATTLGLLQKAEKTKEERDKKAYLDPVKAKEAKERGNNLFKENQYPEAIKEYTEALKRDPTDHTLYSNRSACYTKMGEYGLGLKDANKCIEMKPDFAKGYSRKGHCHFFMKEYEQALKAYDKGLEIDPNNAEMTEGVKRTVTAMNAPQPGQKGGQSDEERLAQAAKDPEVQQILSDPVMRQILQDMQSDPSAAQNHLKNPLVMQKVQKLVNAGVLKVGSR